MSATVSWYDEHHTEILAVLAGKCTWSELFAAIDDNVALMDEINHTVNVISDMRLVEHWPIMLSADMRKLVNAPHLSHPNSGMFIFLGTKPFHKAVFEIFRRLYPRVAARCQFVDDEEQLKALLARSDARSSAQ